MLKRVFPLLVLALLSTCLFADAPLEPPLPPELAEKLESAKEVTNDRFYQEFLRMLFSLSFLIALLIVSLWLFKRLIVSRTEKTNAESRIKLLEQRSLSQKSTLYLVEIEDEKFLIAESPSGMQPIGKLSK